MWLSLFFCWIGNSLEHSRSSDSGFAYPTRRSTSSLVRRRVRIYCSQGAKSRLFIKQSLWLSLFFCWIGNSLEHSRFSDSGFAYSTQRSISLLVRRRMWIYCYKGAKFNILLIVFTSYVFCFATLFFMRTKLIYSKQKSLCKARATHIITHIAFFPKVCYNINTNLTLQGDRHDTTRENTHINS